MKIYLDSSVVLRYLLAGDVEILQAPREAVFASSELMEIECKRVLQRERLEGHVDDARYAQAIGALDELLPMLSSIDIGSAVKRRAMESFTTVIGTLDAIHLATALLWQEEGKEPVSMWTHDRQLRICAAALGMEVYAADRD